MFLFFCFWNSSAKTLAHYRWEYNYDCQKNNWDPNKKLVSYLFIRNEVLLQCFIRYVITLLSSFIHKVTSALEQKSVEFNEAFIVVGLEVNSSERHAFFVYPNAVSVRSTLLEEP